MCGRSGWLSNLCCSRQLPKPFVSQVESRDSYQVCLLRQNTPHFDGRLLHCSLPLFHCLSGRHGHRTGRQLVRIWRTDCYMRSLLLVRFGGLESHEVPGKQHRSMSRENGPCYDWYTGQCGWRGAGFRFWKADSSTADTEWAAIQWFVTI